MDSFSSWFLHPERVQKRPVPFIHHPPPVTSTFELTKESDLLLFFVCADSDGPPQPMPPGRSTALLVEGTSHPGTTIITVSTTF